MAEITETVLVDDMDGTTDKSRPIETHTFAFDGVVYEIDLHADNEDQMRTDFSRYIEKARQISRGTVLKTVPSRAVTYKKKPHTDRAQLDAKRDWLRNQGYEVSKFGRIPTELEDLYDRLAHPSARERNTPPLGEDRKLFSAAAR